MTTKSVRILRMDAAEYREDEALFREDLLNIQSKVLFADGARVGAFLHDSAHITASGVFPYLDDKGGIRMEWRPPQEVQDSAFLNSLQGIPVTMLHPKNAKDARKAMIGMVKGPGMPESINDSSPDVGIRGEVVVYDADDITGSTVRGLSLGFSCDLIFESGLTPEGVTYDAIQRNLRGDHLAVVPNPRVPTARLNLDHDDIGKPKMPQVRLDNGIEYEAAAEVIHALTEARRNIDSLQARADSATAEATSAKAKADAAEGALEKARNDARDEAFAAAKARIELEASATTHGVTVKADATDTDIRSAVVKAIRGDGFSLEGKSPEYVQVAYDMAIVDGAPASKPRHTMLHGDAKDTDTGTGKPAAKNDGAEHSAAKAQADMLAGIGGRQ